jgi:asparagine synthase (glutamine-hydrolysing)
MCGIAGIIDFRGKSVIKEGVQKMTDCMQNRGPDDEGFFITPEVGFGMRRLSIIDIDKGRQPIANEDGTIQLVFNGEIYNYEELRRSLQERGHVFRSLSDTEVIVHAYEEKGVGCLEDLNGMFAFALYDIKRGGVLIARDRVGVKPLYFAQRSSILYFSSDLSALRNILRPRMSSYAFLSYLGHAYIPSPFTAYEDVYKFSAGAYMWVDARKTVVATYWNDSPKQLQCVSIEEAALKLEALLKDSITINLRSHVPVGIMLSGGLDSGAIALFASQAHNRPLHTFSVRFSDKTSADSECAKELASHIGSIHQELFLDSEAFHIEIESLFKNIDEPIADSAIIPTYFIARHAKKYGINVLLSGAGGDEIFGGYGRYFAPKIFSPTWISEALPLPMRALAGKCFGILDPVMGIRSCDPAFAYQAGISRADLELCRRYIRNTSDYEAILRSMRMTHNAIATEQYDGFSLSRMHLDFRHYLRDDILSLTDKATMAASVEGRVPLLDHRIIEFMYSLPHDIIYANQELKGLFKVVLDKYFTKKYIHRKKEGFNAPIRSWINTFMRGAILDEFNHPCELLDELFKMKELRRKFENTDFPIHSSETIFAMYLWNRWSRIHA